jgi:general secretion pathway protein C
MADRWYEPKHKAKWSKRVMDLFARLRARSGQPKSQRMQSFLQSESLLRLRSKLIRWTLIFGSWFQLTVLPILRRFDWKLIQGLSAVLVVSFFLANSISTFAASGVLSLAQSAGHKKAKKAAKSSADVEPATGTVGGSALGSPQLANTVALKKEILQRNLFNSEGKLAPEAGKDDQRSVKKDLSLNFDDVPCTKGELPVQITGTIFTGDARKSFVILKDPKIADADIYKPGDAIIDHEDFEIYKVERGRLEVRKGNTKICESISGYGKNDDSANSSGEGAAAKPAGESKEFEFDAAFISQEIGPGYATILNCAKLIPDVDSSGKMQGFKMISIATSCLFDRIQIQNGDVLTEVNGVSLKDPGQGFKLYQSLQEERTTTINILRNGQPITRIVRVK